MSAILAVVPGYAQGSALVLKNDWNGTLDFYTTLNFTGPAASPQIALDSSAEISRLWNESRAQVFLWTRYYRVRFFISTHYHPSPVMDSGSCAENFVTVEQGDARTSRSFYKMGGRSGTFYLSDDLGRSTTTAHEYGHGLGLDHDDLNQVLAPIPGIMFPRGTYVHSRYQWNPNVAVGAPGGSLNPRHRKVRPLDILRLDLSKLVFSGGMACLGQGRPIPILAVNTQPLHPPAPKSPELLLERSY
jgi:hypothetical protein